jgi:hypothetical protein
VSPHDPTGVARVRATIEDAQDARVEPPRPLMRELPAPDPFPVDSLGDVLALAARAIHDRVQAPLAVCGQSVLAAATLAIQGHADVVLPTGHARPLSSFLITVAATGERKSAVDTEALRPVRRREAALREAYEGEAIAHRNALDAWDAARKFAIKSGKGDLNAIGAALGALGPAPQAPLHPVLTCPEPTYEGMCKLMLDGQPSIGIFASEGGQFVGGHGMSDDAKLRTAAGLSALWDGETIKRVRAQEGVTVLPGRRAAMHLMAQPDVAAIWMADRLLVDQGFMSRVLITAPEPASGSRIWREPKPESEVAMQHYVARLLDVLGDRCRSRPTHATNWRRDRFRCRLAPAGSGSDLPIMSRRDLAMAGNSIRSAGWPTSWPSTLRAWPAS